MTLRLTQLESVDAENVVAPIDSYLLIVVAGTEEIASEIDIRTAISQMFELSKTLSGVSRKQTFENESGEMLEIEQDTYPEMICVRPVS